MRIARLASLSLLALSAPAAPGQAQAPDARGYVLRRGADTVAVERVVRIADGLRGERLVNRVVLTEYRIALGPDGRLTGRAREHDLAHPPEEIAIAPPPGILAVTIGGQSVGLLEWLVSRAAARPDQGAVPVPVWRADRGLGDTALVERSGSEARVRLGGLRVELGLDADGRILRGRFPDHGVELSLVPSLPDGALQPEHPYAPIAGAGYRVEEAGLSGAAGHRLAGSLTLPAEASGPVPPAVLVTGLRANDRKNSGPRAYVPFREIADALTRRGIAVLRLDDRGVGGTAGDHDAATSRDEAGDIAAAVAYLRGRPEIGGAVALAGLSEGAVVAPMVAAEDSTIAAVVLLGGLGG